MPHPGEGRNISNAGTNKVMGIDGLFEYLPHRFPFLLVDRITALDLEAKTVTGYKNVTYNEPFFTGHFPNLPIMPGVLITEAMAQVGGILAFKSLNEKPEDGVVYYLAGVDKARFKRPVGPGDQLVMTMELVLRKRSLVKFRGQATVDGELACSAEILCSRQELQIT